MSDRLPSSIIADCLDALARRIRWRRLRRGVCWLIIALAAVAVLLFLADTWLGLSISTLRIAVLATLVGMLAGAVFPFLRVVRPLERPVLAAVVEKSYPELGERLTSAVLLTGKEAESGYGAAAFIEQLERETAERLHTVDPARCLSQQRGRVSAGAAAACLVLTMALAVLSPGFRDFGQRICTCWLQTPSGVSIDVRPGNSAAARGRPLTLTATLQLSGVLKKPATCCLVVKTEDALPQRLLMQEKDGTFSHTLASITGDFDYYVEAGDFASPEYHITSVEPVDILSDPILTVTPPDYVNPQIHPRRQVQQGGDLSILQYSAVRLDFAFTRPASAGQLEIAAAPRNTEPSRPLLLPLALTGECFRASLQLPALTPGAYTLRLILKAEHGISTVRLLPRITVWSDEPPVFTDVRGRRRSSASVSQVPLDDVLLLKLMAEDKVGLALVELEYRVNGGPILSANIARPAGKPVLATEYLFDLRGRVKDSDLLEYRLKAGDNRRLPKGRQRDAAGNPAPATDLGAQLTYEPAPEQGKTAWHSVVVRPNAKPFAEQGVLASQKRFVEKLRGIQKQLGAEQNQLQKARKVSGERVDLTPELKNQLELLARANRDLQKSLRELGLEAFTNDDWQALAAPAFAISEDELQKTGQLLDQARNHALEVGHRDKRLRAADVQLTRAAQRLEELLQQLGRLASDQIDQKRLANLAQRQENLGNEAEVATDGRQFKSLATEEEHLAKSLQELIKNSKLLQGSMDAAKNPDPIAHMAAKQQELTQQAAKLLQSAKAGQDSKMNAADALADKKALEHMSHAADLLKKNDRATSAGHMKQAEMALSRLGGAPNKESKSGAKMSPAGEARELARRQKELHDALVKFMAAARSKADAPLQTGRALREGQRQVEAALKALRQSQRAPARAAMDRAARALQLAARQARNQGKRSGSAAVAGKDNRPRGQTSWANPGRSDPRLLADDLRQYLGARWGDLPGQMKTRLLQDMRARFGEEYSKIIRDYFEKLAEP